MISPSIDQRLEGIIMKALAKKPTDRHQTARHLAATLRKILPDLIDVPVGKVAKAYPGSLRPGGPRSRPAPAPAAGAPAALPDVMESAKTMVAEGLAGPPPAVVLRAESGPSSDDMVDSAPARIRRVDDDDDDSKDSDDSMRTLVRAPMREVDEPQRFGPKHTEVIMPSAAPARPHGLASLRAPPPPPPRIPKPTLKSASDFKPGPDEAASAPAPSAPTARPISSEIQGLPPPAAILAREGVAPVVTHAALAATTQIEAPGLLMLGPADAVSGTAQTVPLISPAMVAAVIAAGPPRSNVVIGPPQIVFASSPAPGAAPAPLAPLPQTPPIFPLTRPLPPDANSLSRISGARGLFIGFLAGALIMALVAIGYLLTR